MYTPFEQISENARVWIYQSNRQLTPTEQDFISGSAKQFCQQWAAHGSGLQATYQLIHDHFLVLAVDEHSHSASGCSIDSSVHFIQGLQNELGLSFFDRQLIAFKKESGIELVPLSDLKSEISAGKITPDTPVYDNTIGTVGDLHNNWDKPAGHTWIRRYFKALANNI